MNATTPTVTTAAAITAQALAEKQSMARAVFAPTKRQIASLITAQELLENGQGVFARMSKNKDTRRAEEFLTVRGEVSNICQNAINSGSHQGLIRGISEATGVAMPADNKLTTCKAWVDGLPVWAQSAKTPRSCEIRAELLERFDVSAYLEAFQQLRTMADKRATAKVATAKVATTPAVTA